MKRLFGLAACAGLISTAAFAANPADWHTCGDTTRVQYRVYPDEKQGNNTSCFQFDSTGTTRTLDVSRCQHFSATFFPDTSGSSGAGEVQLYSCPTEVRGTGATTGCEKILSDTDGDGLPNDTTLTGDPTATRLGISDIAPRFLVADITSASTSFGRVQVTCKP